MRYQIANETVLKQQQRVTINYYLTGAAICSGGFVLLFYLFLLGFKVTTPNVLVTILFLIVLSMLIFGALLFLFYANMYSKDITKLKKDKIKSVEIADNSIMLEYFDGKRKRYPFTRNRLYFNVGFANFYARKVFNSPEEFFNECCNYVEKIVNKKKNKEIYPVIEMSERVGNTIKLRFALVISLKAIGGMENFRKMIDEWREKYYAYLGKRAEKHKKVEKITRKEEKIERNRKVIINFWASVVLIIFAVLTFIYLSLIPYINTPPTSPDYEQSLNLMEIDAVVTIVLVVVFGVKLPTLWKVMHERDEKNKNRRGDR